MVWFCTRKCGRAVLDVLLDERFAVEDAGYVIGCFDESRIHTQRFEPQHMLPDHGEIGAVVATTHGLHVERLQLGSGRDSLKRNCLWAKPGLVFHDYYVAGLIDNERSVGGRRGRRRQAERRRE